ncbi:MAG: LLM class flavin-dependent oxidoreductase [Kouleothrix sp.]|jgi:5,10-methylenetetrahydromethanopterin reductase|nr:LLM class flavin-dependent oxidoreductase [Kouleothrix sp.]
MGRYGLAFLGAPRVPEMVELAQQAEAAGCESVWIAETRITRDGFVPAGAIAARTERIGIGTGIVNVFTRGPVLNAISFATLDEASGGRAIAGLGPGSPLVLAAQGHSFDRPLTRLREYVAVLRLLLRGGPVQYAGATVQVAGAQLEFEPTRSAIPVHLGVTGPKALELAGEIADGVMLNGFLPPAYVRRAGERIAAGAARAGRDVAAIDVSMALITSAHPDGKLARDAARPFVAMYMTRMPNIAAEMGFADELLARVRAAVADGGIAAGLPYVTDDMVRAVTVAGTPDECRARIDDYRAAGVGLPILFPLGDLRHAIDLIALR